jgi:hypothetical protein
MPVVFCASINVTKEEIEQRRRDCNEVSIRLERSKQWLPDSTYYVTHSITQGIPMLHALVSLAPIVRPNFIDEVLRRAQLSKEEPDSLQGRFRLPDPKSYLPHQIPESYVMTEEEARTKLVVNEKRKTLFVGATLLFPHGEDGLRRVSETAV